jgi:transposase-like protein
MPKLGPRTTYRYSRDFKATAVRLSQLPGVAVRNVAESLYIHPFMLSRWRKQAREGLIMTKGVAVDKAVVARKRGQSHLCWRNCDKKEGTLTPFPLISNVSRLPVTGPREEADSILKCIT